MEKRVQKSQKTIESLTNLSKKGSFKTKRKRLAISGGPVKR
jgi:hypothetical protein